MINRDYYMVTFISSPISPRRKRYHLEAEGCYLFSRDDVGPDESNHDIIYLSLIYYDKILNFLKFINFSLSSPIVFGLVRTLLDIFTIFFSFLFSYLCALSVLVSCWIGPNYVEISTKSVKRVFTSAILSMTFKGTWALIQALILDLILILARISVRHNSRSTYSISTDI